MRLPRWMEGFWYVLSGRSAYDRTIEEPEVPPVELPEIEPRPRNARPTSKEDRDKLDQRDRDQELQLRILRLKAQVRRNHDA